MNKFHKFISFFFLLNINFFTINECYANEFANPKTNEPKSLKYQDFYLIGPGDKLSIQLTAYPEDKTEEFVLNDEQ